MLNVDTLKEKIGNIVNTKKLKEFSTSNTGLVTIAIALAVILVGLHFIHKHSEESSENASLSSWSTTGASSSTSASPTYSFAEAPDLKTSAKNGKTGNKENRGNAFITPENQNLQAQITALKDEVSLLEKQVNQLTLSNLKKPYQLLGVRFGTNSKQWLADIKSGNTLYSLKAGETFEGWHVLSVDNEGAQIE